MNNLTKNYFIKGHFVPHVFLSSFLRITVAAVIISLNIFCVASRASAGMGLGDCFAVIAGPCDSEDPSFSDADMDNVGDACDVDDDNDGILDVNEFLCQTLTSSENVRNFMQLSGAGNYNNVNVGDKYCYPDGLIGDSQSYDIIIEFTGFNNISGLRMYTNAPSFIMTGDASQDSYFTVNVTYAMSGTVSVSNPNGEPVTFNNIVIVIPDVDSGSGLNFTEVSGLDSSHSMASYSMGSDLEQQGFINNNPSSYNSYRLLSGTPPDWTADRNSRSTDTDHQLSFELENISSVNLIFGLTGSEGGLIDRFFEFNNNGQGCSWRDTDSDGIYDHLDLDSDGDDCPDAIDGDGGFNYNDLTNDRLSGPTTTEGLPMAVGSGGQGKGTALDSTDSPCANVTLAINDINQIPQARTAEGNVLENDVDYENNLQIINRLDTDGDGVVDLMPVNGTAYQISNNEMTLGTLEIDPVSGDYEFIPENGYNGTVEIAMEICDDGIVASCMQSNLSIEVLPEQNTGENGFIKAINDTNKQSQGTTVASKIVSNDSDLDDDNIEIQQLTALDANGESLLLLGNPQDVYDENGLHAGSAYLSTADEVVFTAAESFTGCVRFNYTARDGNGSSDDANLTVVVTDDMPDNNIIANDDAALAPKNTVQAGNILTNDYDPEGNSFVVRSALDATGSLLVVDGLSDNMLPGGGTLILSSNGDYTYTPALDAIGTELIEYEVCDNNSNSTCQSAVLYLTNVESSALLPAELLSFSALLQKGTVELEWTTVSEKNVSHFVVQRSDNGKDFIQIAKTKASGNTAGRVDYSALDINPLKIRSYYRLATIDLDGAEALSRIVEIDFLALSNGQFTLQPNPASDRVVINNESLIGSEYKIFNQLGNHVFSGTFSNSDVDLSHLSAGSYYVKPSDIRSVTSPMRLVIHK